MLVYPKIAITAKTIEQFRYHMYNDISVNMLKYNNDSSAILRILSALIDTSCDILEDLKYKPRFNLSALDFTTIDRFNGFPISYIPSVTLEAVNDSLYLGEIKGYSAYTDEVYTLEYVSDEKDFSRHSFPCDCFIGEMAFSDGYETIQLPPYIKVETDIEVLNSRITISPFRGFKSIGMENSKSVTVRVIGLSLTGKYTEEDVVIEYNKDYTTKTHFSLVTGLMAIGSSCTLTVVVYPYMTGTVAEWDEEIIDRESYENYKVVISIDQVNKKLLFSGMINSLTYPGLLEDYMSVDIQIDNSENILQSYVDVNNKLVYVVTDASKLYCFPLIIPISYTDKLDDIKTIYQSVKVEYTNDQVNREFTFYVFPSTKTNDVESMSIFINGEEYLGQGGIYSDMLLDLIRTNIETNKIVIPYDDIFTDSNESLVEFRTFGVNESVTPLWLTNLPLIPLYSKDLSDIKVFTTTSPNNFIESAMTSNNVGYEQYVSGDMGINEQCSLMKLSSVGNVLLNGYRIENVFKTFTVDEENGVVITSDTITHVSGVI